MPKLYMACWVLSISPIFTIIPGLPAPHTGLPVTAHLPGTLPTCELRFLLAFAEMSHSLTLGPWLWDGSASKSTCFKSPRTWVQSLIFPTWWKERMDSSKCPTPSTIYTHACARTHLHTNTRTPPFPPIKNKIWTSFLVNPHLLLWGSLLGHFITGDNSYLLQNSGADGRQAWVTRIQVQVTGPTCQKMKTTLSLPPHVNMVYTYVHINNF